MFLCIVKISKEFGKTTEFPQKNGILQLIITTSFKKSAIMKTFIDTQLRVCVNMEGSRRRTASPLEG